MPGYPFDTFGSKHIAYLGAVVSVIVLVVWVGIRFLNPRQRRQVAVGLVILSLGQELADDLLRAYLGVWFVDSALPLHLCSLAMLMSVWALLTRKQLVFEVAYYWAFAACSQALLTPDNTRWRMGELDVFWNFLSHGAIVLNVCWLVFVVGMRCRPGSWWKVLLITNLTAVPVGLVNLVLNSNYLFICWKPGGSSPFLIGEWPWYILGFEVLAGAFFLLLYLPMAWATGREPTSLPRGVNAALRS